MSVRGSKNPNARLNPGFKAGKAWIGNAKGRPPVGKSYAEQCRAVAGADGSRLAWIWACVGGARATDELEKQLRDPLFTERVKKLMGEATTRDKLWCLGRLEDRAYGMPKQEVEHSGEVSLPTTVIHEYHASS